MFLEPGRVERFEIDMTATGVRFLPGHRIRPASIRFAPVWSRSWLPWRHSVRTDSTGPLTLRVKVEQWPLVAPFRIAGYMWEFIDVLLVSLEKDGHVGQGEAAGVYYKNDRPASMLGQFESLRTTIGAEISRDRAQSLLPRGGAR